MSKTIITKLSCLPEIEKLITICHAWSAQQSMKCACPDQQLAATPYD